MDYVKQDNEDEYILYPRVQLHCDITTHGKNTFLSFIRHHNLGADMEIKLCRSSAVGDVCEAFVK